MKVSVDEALEVEAKHLVVFEFEVSPELLEGAVVLLVFLALPGNCFEFAVLEAENFHELESYFDQFGYGHDPEHGSDHFCG